MFEKLKYWLKKISPVPLSKNHRYDILTRKIISRHCKDDSNCIDVGCYKGEILDWMLKSSPAGTHFAFEPIPKLYQELVHKYRDHPNCRIYNYAISNTEGEIPFNYVITNPSYSGIRQRKYDRRHEKDTTIIVQTKRLDDVIPVGIDISFIKIDVEGGEMDVLLGSTAILQRSRPLVIFEFGIGASDVYDTTPEKLFSFFEELGYSISLLDRFIQQENSLSLAEFTEQFERAKNYYFVAYPKIVT